MLRSQSPFSTLQETTGGWSQMEACKMFFYCFDYCLNYHHHLPLIAHQQCVGYVLSLHILFNLFIPTAFCGTNSYTYFTSKETKAQKSKLL